MEARFCVIGLADACFGYGFGAGNRRNGWWWSADSGDVQVAAWREEGVSYWFFQRVNLEFLVSGWCLGLVISFFINRYSFLSPRWCEMMPMSQLEGCPNVFQVVWSLPPGYHQVRLLEFENFRVKRVWAIWFIFVLLQYGPEIHYFYQTNILLIVHELPWICWTVLVHIHPCFKKLLIVYYCIGQYSFKRWRSFRSFNFVDRVAFVETKGTCFSKDKVKVAKLHWGLKSGKA